MLPRQMLPDAYARYYADAMMRRLPA